MTYVYRNRFIISALVFTGIFSAIGLNAKPVDKPIQDKAPDVATIRADAAQIERERVKQLSCLAFTIWGEARSESELGQALVANVILNRVDSPKFPDTICGVVHQRKQFSMYNKGDVNGKKAHKAFTSDPSDEVLTALKISIRAMDAPRHARLLPAESVNYHTTAVNPSWGKRLTKYEVVGAHKFYVN